MSRRRTHKRGAFGPNMTPMVDVVMVILVFFMGAMGLAAVEQHLRTGAPKEARDQSSSETAQESKAQAKGEEATSRAVLRLRRAGGVTVVSGLGMESAPLAEVDRKLSDFAQAGAGDGLIVIVAPSGDVPYQDVVIVHDSCAKAGLQNVRLGVIGE
ncbi:MAG: ExbD/TolR family protein [Phycisphaerales bacterium]